MQLRLVIKLKLSGFLRTTIKAHPKRQASAQPAAERSVRAPSHPAAPVTLGSTRRTLSSCPVPASRHVDREELSQRTFNDIPSKTRRPELFLPRSLRRPTARSQATSGWAKWRLGLVAGGGIAQASLLVASEHQAARLGPEQMVS